MVNVVESLKNFVNGTQLVEQKSDIKSSEKIHADIKKHHETSFTERVTALIEKGESKTARSAYTVVAVTMALIIIGCLIYTVSFLPHFGGAGNPANSSEVVRAYIENGIH